MIGTVSTIIAVAKARCRLPWSSVTGLAADGPWVKGSWRSSMSSLYLHIPFCLRRCPYCDFFSQVADVQERRRYVQLLTANLLLLPDDIPCFGPLQTIYFGGGTPSLLAVDEIDSLLATCADLFGLAADCEITFEANPGTLEGSYLQEVRRAGVNRLSLGIQTFDPRQLRILGRYHSSQQGLAAVTAARKAGFDNLSLDLMFALPGQQLPDLDREIDLFLQQDPEHLSIYGLTFEEGTEFERRLQRGELTPCHDEDYASQYELLRARFQTAGYEHYELSNFARPGRRCRHNQVYWQRRTCLAAGCGAHSFNAHGFGERRHIPPDPVRYRKYLEAGMNPAESLERFDRDGAMREFVYLALRTHDGIDLAEFEKRFGCQLQTSFAVPLERLQDSLLVTSERIALRPEHWLIYDHLVSAFL